MSAIVVEQPCESKLATPTGISSTAKSQAHGTMNRALSVAPEPMDVDSNKQDIKKTLKDGSDATANGKAKAGDLSMAVADATVKHKVESSSETSRKLVDQAKRRLQIQMQYVENARFKIMDETHPDMTERLQGLVKERDRLMQVAKQRSDYFQDGTSVIFEYECDEANSEYELQCEKLRQDMLDEIHNEMEILYDQRKGSHSHARITTRKTRSTRNKPELDLRFANDTAQKIKKRAGGYVFQPLENKLGQLEIDYDVRELATAYEATKKRRMASDYGRGVTKYYRNKFLYRDWIFQEGDEVYVLDYAASREYAAIICGVSSTELLVLSEKGKYYRLAVTDLRQSRVVLTMLSSEEATARDDLDDASP